MAQFNWDSVSKEALLKTLKFYRTEAPPKAKTPKGDLVSDAKAFLIENPDKIDPFFLKLAESQAKKDAV
jgi:hypothetical protein